MVSIRYLNQQRDASNDLMYACLVNCVCIVELKLNSKVR